MKNLSLLLAIFPSFAVYLDLSSMSIIFPTINSSYPNVSVNDLSWILNSYTIISAAFLIPGGRYADKIGIKKVYILGLCLFITGASIILLSNSFIMIIVARSIQGLSASLILPTSIAIILENINKSQQAKYIGLISASTGLSVVVGPLLSSLILQYFTWKMVFILPLFLSIICLIIAGNVLKLKKIENTNKLPQKIDVIFIISSISLISLSIIKYRHWGIFDIKTILSFIFGVLIFSIALIKNYINKNPLIDLKLFKSKNFLYINIITLFNGIFFFSYVLSTIYYLKEIWHFPPLLLGICFIIGPLSSIPASIITGRISSKYGYKKLFIIGFLLFAIMSLFRAITFYSEPNILLIWAPAQILGGVGIGMFITCNISLVTYDLPAKSYALGAAINNALRQIGGVFGVAISVLVFENIKTNPTSLAYLFLAIGISGLISSVIGLFLTTNKY